jgi:hypothetical protein
MTAPALERRTRSGTRRVKYSAAVLVAVVALCLAADDSFGATASVQNRALIYVAEGANDNTLEVSGPACYSPVPGPCPPDRVLIRLLDFGGPFGRTGGEPITPGDGCIPGTDISGGPPPPPPGPGPPPPPPGPPPPFPPDREVYCSADVDVLAISLAEGDDWLFDSTGKPGLLSGGPGDDRLEDGSENDIVDGGSGNDTFHAEPGDDRLFGGEGSDTYYALQCPPPPDRCDPAANSALDTGQDSFSGGIGDDRADFSDIFASERLSADGANDDGKPGEGDDIRPDVENISAGPFTDTVVGNAADNDLDGGDGNDALAGGSGHDVLDGGAGPDVLDGGAGSDGLHGGAGGDSVSYASRTTGVEVTLDRRFNDGEPGEFDHVAPDVEDVTGGSGDDDLTGSSVANRLHGRAGEDFLDGGPGPDALSGGRAADLLRLRGGPIDPPASCGPGTDFVIADPGERGLSNCEDVDAVLADRPVRGRRVAVEPLRKRLRVRLPAAHRFVTLRDHLNLPVRSEIDALRRPVELTGAVAPRRTRTMTVSRGSFVVRQSRGRPPITELVLPSYDGGASVSSGRAHAAFGVGILFEGRWHRFRVRGDYAIASRPRSRIVVENRRRGTFVEARSGRVTVYNCVRRRTRPLRAPRHLLARRGGRRC